MKCPKCGTPLSNKQCPFVCGWVPSDTKSGLPGKVNKMSDANIPIISKPTGEPAVKNLSLMAATIPDLLSEIERRGVDLPHTSFQLVQQMHALRNERWQAPARGIVAMNQSGAQVTDGYGNVLAIFLGVNAEAEARAYAQPAYSTFERAAEIAGEVGELVNVTKKLRRHEMGLAGNYKPGEATHDELLEKTAYEIGDVFVTCFNLVNKLNIDAWNCLQLAFNTKSKEMNFPEKL